MSPEPTGVHGLLKQRKLFTHKEYYIACKNGKCKINPRTKSYNDIYEMSEQECIEKVIEEWNMR